MNYRFLSAVVSCGPLLAGIVGGCGPVTPHVAPSELPVIPVAQPIRKDVTDYVDYTGQTNAMNAVSIIPRVTGYIVRIPFEEGADVKKGDLLFEIDPRPYQAQLDQAEGQLHLYDAQLKLAIANYARAKELARTPGAISAMDVDAYRAQEQEADAALKAAKASLEVYNLNLSFTKVTSPIEGRISRYYLTLGNLVNQDQTLLTTVVSLDPIYAYFDVDEPTVLQARRAINAGKMKAKSKGQLIPVLMGLQGEEGFPHQGGIDFFNNQVNPSTGSLSVRGVFENPLPAGGVRVLSPGMFVRIRLPIGAPHPALLVIDRAVSSDQGLKFVYVLDAQNKAQYRRITTGPLQDDGLRVIVDGVQAGEWIAIGGLQQVRPRMEIKPEQMTMPTLAQPAVPIGAATQSPATAGKPPGAASEPSKPQSTPAAQTKR
jgi:multidrug efflux system membrane fusion protein